MEQVNRHRRRDDMVAQCRFALVAVAGFTGLVRMEWNMTDLCPECGHDNAGNGPACWHWIESTLFQKDPLPAMNAVPHDWPDCPHCGAMRFYPSGRCMQGERCSQQSAAEPLQIAKL